MSLQPHPTPRQPPASPQIEQGLLAALLMNSKAATRVAASLRPDQFADPAHARIYAAITRRVAAGGFADLLTVNQDLGGDDVFQAAGGMKYLTEVVTRAFVGHGTAEPYAKEVKDLWLRRQVIAVGDQIIERAHTGAAGELVAEAAGKLLELGEEGVARQGVDIREAAAEAIRQCEAAYRGDAGHLRLGTGLPSLDNLLGGLWPGQLTYLMARSRTGKSAAMLQIARHVAASLREEADKTGEPPGHVHIFSLEMTATDLATVNLAATTRWTAEEIRSGNIGGPADWLELDRASAALGKLPIIVDDVAEMDLLALCMRARATAQMRRTRLIMIDYRELIRRPREHAKMGLPEWVPFLGYQLKALAKATNVPVIALAQINKSRDSADSTTPTLSDLPYDGGQAADVVAALHRPELYLPAEPPQSLGKTAAQRAAAEDQWRAERRRVAGIAEAHTLKRRFGATGMCRLRWDGPRMMLREIGDDT